MEILTISSLSKRFSSTQALDNVNLQLHSGTIYGLVGNNGAGKTTLFRILAGLVRPDAGTIQIFGETDQKHLRQARKRMGFLLSRECFQASMTATENLLALQKLRGYTDRQEVARLLDLVGLEPEKATRNKLCSLSSGQFQRCAIAATMLGSPELLVLDEPQNGLDPNTVLQFRTWMLALKEKGTAILLSSHNLPELYRLADEYIFLNHGQVLETVSHESLKNKLNFCVTISSPNPSEQIVSGLKTQFPELNYTIQGDGSLRVLNCPASTEQLRQLLISKQISITSLHTEGLGLEDYFLNLVGANEE